MLWSRLPRPRPRRTTHWRPHLDPLEERTLLSLTTFSVDDTQSSLTLSGNIQGQPLQEQAPGSLVTAYTGSFLADVDFSKALITFTHGADGITAENSGDWQPRADGSPGAEPASYGGQVAFLGTQYFALRNMELRLRSDPLPLTPLGDGVSYGVPNDQFVKAHRGRAAYNFLGIHGTIGLGRLAGNNQADSDGNASYVSDVNGDGSLLEFHLAIDFTGTATIHRFHFTFQLDGVIVAYGSLGVVGPSASHSRSGSAAVLGTSLVAGTQVPNQTLPSSPVDRLAELSKPEIKPADMATVSASMPRLGFDGPILQVSHRVRVDPADAAFIGLGPMEPLAI